MANETENKKLADLLYEDIKKLSRKNSQTVIQDDGNKDQVSNGNNEKRNDNTTQSVGSEYNQTQSQNETGTTEGEGATQSEEIKRGRGRHKKDCDCANCQAKRNATNNGTHNASQGTKSGSSNLVNDLAKYQKVKVADTANAQTNGQQPSADPNKVDLSKFISGALLLICMDAIFPSVIIYIAGFVDKKYKRMKSTSKKKLKLTAEEREELEPLADEIIKVLFGMVHPAVAFLVATGIIYAGKLFSLDDTDFHEQKFVTDKKDEGGKK